MDNGIPDIKMPLTLLQVCVSLKQILVYEPEAIGGRPEGQKKDRLRFGLIENEFTRLKVCRVSAPSGSANRRILEGTG